MAKGGFPGLGGGNMNNLLKQAQMMQKKMQDMQEELEKKEFTATSGGGVVEAVSSGKKELLSIKIKPEAVDPDDVEMLEDLILSAVNEAFKKAEAETAEEMKKITGGMNMPGMF
ncbi:MAG: YbaB/EbfC family nucleoid-associated protein [Bacillota bacterium]|nr:YbaB/EbfC family nucleoid-associated protein [Bacillota bacterium]